MNRSLLALLLLAITSSSSAVTPTAKQSLNPPGRTITQSTTPEAAKAMADDSSGLRKGTIDAVDIPHGTFRVFGQAHTFDANKVRIFGKNGKPTGVHSLQRGATVRFTLDPADASHRRVAVIYVD